MRMIITSSLLVAAAYIPASQAFFAGAPAPSPSPPPVDLKGYTVVADRTLLPLNQVGVPDPEIAGLPAGFNAGVALDHSLKLALPEGWRAAIGDGVVVRAPVSWGSGLTWLQAIEQVAVQTNTAATVYWPQRIVTLSPMPAVSSLTTVSAAALPMSNVSVSVFDAAGEPAADAVVEVSQRQEVVATEPSVPLSLQPAVYTVQSPPLAPSVATTEAPAAVTTPAPVITAQSYPDMSAFLSETVAIEGTGLTLVDALQALLPKDWSVDTHEAGSSLDDLRMDLSYAGPRGEAINSIGQHQDLVLITYLDANKILVSRRAD